MRPVLQHACKYVAIVNRVKNLVVLRPKDKNCLGNEWEWEEVIFLSLNPFLFLASLAAYSVPIYASDAVTSPSFPSGSREGPDMLQAASELDLQSGDMLLSLHGPQVSLPACFAASFPRFIIDSRPSTQCTCKGQKFCH